LQVFQEEVIFIYPEWKLWLQIASTTLSQLGMLSIMIVEIDSCQQKRRSWIGESSDW
jgi:hypothetical protein